MEGFDPGPGFGGRLFFAVVPDVATAAEIYRLAGILKDAHRFDRELIAPRCLHVTLLFLDRWTEQLAGSICEAMAGVKMKPFDVSFDRTVSFRGKPGNHPFVLLGDDAMDPLKSLRADLGNAIADNGVRVRVPRAFKPHVTLLYGDRAIDEYPVEPICWTVHEFVLIHSLRGHTHLARWRFDV